MYTKRTNDEKEEKMKTKIKMRFKTWLLAALFVAAAVIAGQGVANAVGTASGTSITNKASINYQVGGVAQTLIESSPTGNTTAGAGNGTNTTFVVDNRVNLTVVSNNAAQVTTYPGSSAIALKFTVTNTGNTTQDFGLSVVTGATNEGGVWATAMYEDTNSNGVYDAGVDLAITYADEIAADGTKVVFIVATVPLTATNGQRNTYALKAQARDSGAAGVQGAITTATVGADTAGVDVVLADADSDGAAADDAAASNGIYVMWANGAAGSGEPAVGTGGYIVSAAVLTITKTSAVVYDPINLAVNPKAIPGARVEYTITIANAVGAATATSITISDTPGANSTFYVDGYAVGKGMQVTAPNLYAGAATALTNAGADDEGDFGITTGGAVTVSGITLTANQSATVKFMVTIN
ncbi:MAG: hypothetical protein HY884_08965 [Deltaproteobacteria bacterium]|nr:hypothetical protein [Deltaproteobacteria bacterium]